MTTTPTTQDGRPAWRTLKSSGASVFLHPCCDCGDPRAAWGEGVSLRDGRLGRWRCWECWKRARQSEKQGRLL